MQAVQPVDRPRANRAAKARQPSPCRCPAGPGPARKVESKQTSMKKCNALKHIFNAEIMAGLPRSILGHCPLPPLVEKPAPTEPTHQILQVTAVRCEPLRGRLLSREGPGHLCPWRKQSIYALSGTRTSMSLEGAGAFMPLMRSGSRVGLQARALLRPGRAGPCLTQPSETLCDQRVLNRHEKTNGRECASQIDLHPGRSRRPFMFSLSS